MNMTFPWLWWVWLDVWPSTFWRLDHFWEEPPPRYVRRSILESSKFSVLQRMSIDQEDWDARFCIHKYCTYHIISYTYTYTYIIQCLLPPSRYGNLPRQWNIYFLNWAVTPCYLPYKGELYYPVSTQLYREYFINHCNKDPYLPISKMECHGGFDHCSTVPRSLRSAPGLLHLGRKDDQDFMLTIKLFVYSKKVPAIFWVKDFEIVFECFRIQQRLLGPNSLAISWKILD